MRNWVAGIAAVAALATPAFAEAIKPGLTPPALRAMLPLPKDGHL